MNKVLFTVAALFCFATSVSAQNYAHFCDIVPGVKNRALQEAGVDAANRKAAKTGCREEFKRATVVSKEWKLCYDGADNLVGRSIHMEVYGETWEGQCGVAHCVFSQKYMGHHEYSKLKCDYIGDFYDMECEAGHDQPEGRVMW